jgi:hypothetical protein
LTYVNCRALLIAGVYNGDMATTETPSTLTRVWRNIAIALFFLSFPLLAFSATRIAGVVILLGFWVPLCFQMNRDLWKLWK